MMLRQFAPLAMISHNHIQRRQRGAERRRRTAQFSTEQDANLKLVAQIKQLPLAEQHELLMTVWGKVRRGGQLVSPRRQLHPTPFAARVVHGTAPAL
jgi:hypothetical protein